MSLAASDTRNLTAYPLFRQDALFPLTFVADGSLAGMATYSYGARRLKRRKISSGFVVDTLGWGVYIGDVGGGVFSVWRNPGRGRR